jgi:hypothetical protein
MTRRDRIRRLELQQLVRLAETVGAPYGLSVEAVFAEMRCILSMPDAEQRAFFADLYATLTAAEARDLDAIRARHVQILRGR